MATSTALFSSIAPWKRLSSLLIVLLLCSLALPAEAAAASRDRKIAFAMDRIDRVLARGSFQPAWESLAHYEVPDWYRDAKFGIFLHWGVYSVPAFDNEWYPRNMYQQGRVAYEHHRATYGPQDRFGYKDFIPMFEAEKFDPAAWADLFRRAGARYVVPVAEHHDGFAMWNTAYSRWNAKRMGPHRDVIGELRNAVLAQGMHFGVSFHRAEHWWFFDGGRKFFSDVQDPRWSGLYGPAQPDSTAPDPDFLREWLARSTELVDKYHPDLVYFDWWIGEKPQFKSYVQKFAAYYYDRAGQWNRGVVVNYKREAVPEHTAVLDVERGQLDHIRDLSWQTDTSISWKSWCYIEDDDYKRPESLLQQLVDIVSKNGSMLLNVGPMADGTIPPQARAILLAMGQWLAANGDAIYGTRAWKIYGEGPTQVAGGAFKDDKDQSFTAADVRFTTKNGFLYAVAMRRPEDGKLAITSLRQGSPLEPREISAVETAAGGTALPWKRDDNALVIEVPHANDPALPVAVRIRFGAAGN